jgi:BNR repeat-like domain
MTPRRLTLTLALAAMAVLVASAVAGANGGGSPILVDPFGAGCPAQHKTVVEPDTYSAGSTIVAAAQTGLFTDGGACDNGFATSTTNGASWTSGVLPGITIYTNPSGPYARASDPAVAYDARHNVWLISSLALDANLHGAAVLASRSTNGGSTWNNPVKIATAGANQNLEKPWIVCDNGSASPFFGSCYAQFDDAAHGKQLKISSSTDGGLTWTARPAPNVGVIGGQPLVQPSGKVIIPIDNASETSLGALVSSNGGGSWTVVTITSITAAVDPGTIVSSPLPSAEIDGAGKVFVTWEDCRFRAGCASNDLVYVTSSDGLAWSAVQRIPIDSVASTVDHLIPGIGVDKLTSGPTAHVSVTYYFFSNVNCTFTTCQLFAGSISSSNGGSTWSAAVTLRGPMQLCWFPVQGQGRFLGDYISTSFAGNGTSHGAVIAANPPCSGFDVALYDPPVRFR